MHLRACTILHIPYCVYTFAWLQKVQSGKETDESPLSSPKENKIRAFVVFFVNVRQNLQNSLHWFDL